MRARVLFACLAQYTGVVLHSSPMTLLLRLRAPLAASIGGGGASTLRQYTVLALIACYHDAKRRRRQRLGMLMESSTWVYAHVGIHDLVLAGGPCREEDSLHIMAQCC